jgi:lipopolysaccharide biosynthesis regulator YciM
MAAQWNLAFKINPKHYLTHWHFGNGHTNLTYADYVHETDDAVRKRLKEADDLIADGRVDEAITLTRVVEQNYPESVLPAMLRGSAYYMHYNMDREARLDSAETTFSNILSRKKNYGPAHNGLAAVIKQRQFSYLKSYEELEKELDKTKIPDESRVFYQVFKDAKYYPGDRVEKMIAQQIGPSKAYLPMINKFGSDFAIPPLHVDLAEAMDNSFFRHGTTFDNRQWMDIRGVGSGATGIEYLERGAHWERNVLAHEYAHLYHGRILTDRENRRIRALYHEAMEQGNVLDYYASNNESEFFAQGYAGFLSDKKVHPLNHKSMNTREYIKDKDRNFYQFLDSLLKKQEDYLAGKTGVFDDNWAQTHVALAQQARNKNDFPMATAQLDTALAYSSHYLPALMEYAEIHAQQGNFSAAEQKVASAMGKNKNYAPIYLTRANIVHEKALQGKMTFEEAIQEQKEFLNRAFKMEKDLSVRAQVNKTYRDRLYSYSYLTDALKVTNAYLNDAPVISTYLRDRKEEAEAYASYLNSLLGNSEQEVVFFEELLSQNPQNFNYRKMAAEVFLRADLPDRALTVLKEGQRILQSAEEESSAYSLQIARAYLLKGNNSQAEVELNRVSVNKLNSEEQLLLAEIYGKLSRVEKAQDIIEELDELVLPVEKAEKAYVKAQLADLQDEQKQALTLYRIALGLNPYHLDARYGLAKLLEERGEIKKAREVRNEANKIGLSMDK